MCEIYKEKIRDLLNVKKADLKIHEQIGKGIYVEGLTSEYCVNEKEVINLLKIGNKNRAVGSNNMNDQSSRSHSIFTLTLSMQNNDDGSRKLSKL